jgi:hypothetical protein
MRVHGPRKDYSVWHQEMKDAGFYHGRVPEPLPPDPPFLRRVLWALFDWPPKPPKRQSR